MHNSITFSTATTTTTTPPPPRTTHHRATGTHHHHRPRYRPPRTTARRERLTMTTMSSRQMERRFPFQLPPFRMRSPSIGTDSILATVKANRDQPELHDGNPSLPPQPPPPPPLPPSPPPHSTHRHPHLRHPHASRGSAKTRAWLQSWEPTPLTLASRCGSVGPLLPPRGVCEAPSLRGARRKRGEVDPKTIWVSPQRPHTTDCIGQARSYNDEPTKLTTTVCAGRRETTMTRSVGGRINKPW